MTDQLFLIATGQDTGGWNWRIREAFRKFDTGWLARSMAATRTYINYPEDLPWRREVCLQMYAGADAIHLQNQLSGWELYDNGQGKPTILQHHGTIFREGHERLSYEARRIGAVEIASTIDLTLLEPGVEWVPVPYDLSELRAIRARFHKPNPNVVRIAHAPTNRRVKGTDHFLAVIERLRDRGLKVETILIEHRSWRDCLQLKANADIYYDQVELGYGCNAVEAWGMGIPVVAGAEDPAVQALMLERWGRYPFAFAETDTLEEVLAGLVSSQTARNEVALMGLEHFERWHDEATVARTLAGIYSAAPAVLPGPIREAKRQEVREERRQDRNRRAQVALERALRRRAELRAERRA